MQQLEKNVIMSFKNVRSDISTLQRTVVSMEAEYRKLQQMIEHTQALEEQLYQKVRSLENKKPTVKAQVTKKASKKRDIPLIVARKRK